MTLQEPGQSVYKIFILKSGKTSANYLKRFKKLRFTMLRRINYSRRNSACK